MVRRLKSLSKKLFIFLNILAVLSLLLAYLSTYVNPEEYTFLALFGIGYGILLVANLIFVVFWLLVRRKWALLSLIAILIGYSHFNAYFQLFPSFKNSPPKDSKSLKINSYNVRLFGWYDWKNNKEYRDSLIAGLMTENSDVYCFQEYFHNSNPNGRFDTENLIKKRLKTPYVHKLYTNSVGRYEKYGIATFSKYPIVNSGKVQFKQEYSNICIFTDIVVAGDTIRIYNAHVASIRFQNADYRFMDEIKNTQNKLKPVLEDGLDVWKRLKLAYRKRAGQVTELMEAIDKSPYPVILCGDFNDTPVSYSYRLVSGQLNDSFRESGWGIGNTYIGKFPSFRIDYIFHSRGLHSVNYHTLPANISDHHGIGATIYWE